jgi:hypothetical protein
MGIVLSLALVAFQPLLCSPPTAPSPERAPAETAVEGRQIRDDPFLQTYALKGGTANLIAKVLQKNYQWHGVSIRAVNQSTILAYAGPDDHEEIAKLIKQFQGVLWAISCQP